MIAYSKSHWGTHKFYVRWWKAIKGVVKAIPVSVLCLAAIAVGVWFDIILKAVNNG